VTQRQISPHESFSRHTQLIDRLHHMLFKVGATSNLLYDPVDFTYLLIISGYQESPRVTELAARMRGLGTGYLTTHEGLASDVRLASDTHGRLLERMGHLHMHIQAASDRREDIRTQLLATAGAKLKALQDMSLATRGLLEGDNASAYANMSPADYFKTVSQPIDAQADMTRQIGRYLRQALEERMAGIQHQLALQGVAVLTLTLISMSLMVKISRSITRPVAQMQALAVSLAKGDLTVSCATARRDELGACMSALDVARTNWVGMLSELKDTISNVSSASTQISAGSHELSDRTVNVTGSIESTTQAIGSLNQTVRQTAEAAHRANQLAQSAHGAARQGEQVMAQVVHNMDDISTSSKRIADILSVIDGIAFQTNILALNAAVEAARAGESGRGFAVVAAEVRSLAQRSATAAKEIKTLIDDSLSKVEAGTTLVHQAGTSMQAIMQSNDQVTGIVDEISAATREQSQGFALVSQAVAEIEQMTHQNAHLVRESNTASGALHAQAEHLTDKVAVFKFEDPRGRTTSLNGGLRLERLGVAPQAL
jgi:methyl-accepting chemotaxis protein